MDRRTFLTGAAATFAAISNPAQLYAETIAQPARLLVGQPPGGSLDTVSRIVTDQMKGYAPSLIVESRPGAAGRIAIESLKRSPADGSVMGIISAAPLTMYPHIYKKLNYDTARDLAPAGPVCSLSFAVMVGPAVSADVKTFDDLIHWLKANPDKANFGSPGTGSLPHFVGAMLAKEVGLNWLHVPYTGAAPALQDLLGGRLPVYLGVASNAVAHKDSPEVRTLAITAQRRLEGLPAVPTMRELGHPALEVVEWVGIFVPKKTPPKVIEGLAAAIVKAQGTPEVQKGLARIGFDLLAMPADKFADLIERDTANWAAVVKETGFKPID